MVQSDKVNPRLDDELAHELQPLIRNVQSPHVEEWRQVEPSGEDQPEVNMDPTGPMLGAVPDGMTEGEVIQRSDIAAHLGKEVWPAYPSDLVEVAADQNAPDWVLEELRRLPEDRLYENMQDVWASLGHGVEQHRF